MVPVMKPSTHCTSRVRCWVVAAVFASGALLASCGGGASSNPGEQTSTAPKPEAAAEQDRGTLDSRGKKWGGWRWKGSRDNCFYIVGNICFEDRAAACEAAGCEEDGCRVDRGAPGKVSCDG